MQESDQETAGSIRNMLHGSAESSVFRRKELLNPEAIIDEDRIVGRTDQIESITTYLKAILNENKPPDLLLHGPSGTGKSLISNTVADSVEELAAERGINFTTLEASCQVINSVDRAMYVLAEQAAENAGVEVDVAKRGVSTDEKKDRFFEILSDHYDSVIVILDEIDLLLGHQTTTSDPPAYSDLLYKLSRTTQLGLQDTAVTICALTNYPGFKEELDGRTRSTYAPENIVFNDYTAEQLTAILKRREDAFVDGALDDSAVTYCAAVGARDHGDARQAVNLLRKAGEVADAQSDNVVTDDHVRAAQNEAEREATLSQMRGLSQTKRMSLFTAAAVCDLGDQVDKAPNAVAYEVYSKVMDIKGAEPKSPDTYLRYLDEMEVYGFVRSEKSGQQADGVYKYYTFPPGADVIVDTLYPSVKDELNGASGNTSNDEFADMQTIEEIVTGELRKFFK